jgi:6-phosphofructokinase 1
VRNGIGVVKLMGRACGFIAASAAIADTHVGLCLIPEIPFSIDGVVAALTRRLHDEGHAVLTVAEGAGQHLLDPTGSRDASGNVQYADIGMFLRDQLTLRLAAKDVDANVKYIDPSYMIRTLPANARDAAFCLTLGHAATHAALAGKTDMVVGYLRGQLTHVPIALAVSEPKKVDPHGRLWSTVLAATGQAADLAATS